MTSGHPEPAEERVIKSEIKYSGRKATLRVDTVDLGDGRTAQREIVEHPGVAAIVPLDAEGNVLFVRQYRLAAEDVLLEIPAGVLDPGEDAGTAAQRELREETGMRAGRMTRLGADFYVSPGISTEWIRLYLAEELSEDALDADEDESIVVERIPLAEAVRMVERGELRDAKSIAGILLVARLRGM